MSDLARIYRILYNSLQLQRTETGHRASIALRELSQTGLHGVLRLALDPEKRKGVGKIAWLWVQGTKYSVIVK